MSKEIYISTTPHETRLAIVEEEQLTEIYFERENEYTLAGSIYNGRVTRVLPGMQSAFVDIGLERDAFLYVTDFMEEQGDAADFESENGNRRANSWDSSNGEHSRRPRNDDAPGTETTQSFDEPVAPSTTEAVDSIEAGSGSRRWRGRRGRRHGRGMSEERHSAPGAFTGSVVPEEDAVIEGGYVEEIEASSAAIEIDLGADVPASEVREEGPRKGRNRFASRDRGARGGRNDRSREQDRQTPRYDNSYAGYGSADVAPESSGEPIVLPGESIRKYRDPAEVAADDARAQAAAPAPGNVMIVSVPSVEVTGWDGGRVLPGESLSRHARSPQEPSQAEALQAHDDGAALAESFDQPQPIETPVHDPAGSAATPVERAEESAPAEAPDGLTGHPAHGLADDESFPDTAAAPVEAQHAAQAGGEYEPAEGASASVTSGSRQDLRRYEQVNEPEAASSAAEAASEALAGETPDPTTYDLHAAKAGGDRTDHSPDPNFTELQSTGEMLSVPEDATHESASVPVQDTPDATQPIAHEGAVQSTGPAEMEAAPVAAEYVDESDEDVLPEIHAYGDGDLFEEEIEGDLDDDYEYVSASGLDEVEVDEYEEEMLEDSGGPDFLLREASLDRMVPDREDDPKTMLQDDVPEDVDDDEGEEVSQAPSGQNMPERRPRRPGNGRERRGGGDRGRGRRQSVQATDLPAINELLKPGQEILVQIAKEPIAKKGARITSHIALPGRFLVFMPTVNHTGVSRKISSDEERRRLKSILLSEKGDAQGGFIVRTAAATATEEELRNDLRFLIHLWNDIKARSESSKSPALIYHDLNLVERILRDQVTDNFSAIWVDTEQEYERVLRFLQRFQPALVRRVKLYTKETPLFEHFSVTQEIDKALKSKVWLKSGGSIVINQTEALVAIDINTGKYVGKTARLEDTILKTNLDAIPEIVRQIRLRDLGGIIVIDFIDMDERKNRAKVLQALEDAMRTDRAPSKILPFNDFGLVIMTRKRVKQSLERTLCIPDPVTEGTGMIKSPVTIANEIYVEMRKMYRHVEKADVLLRVHPEVVKTLKSNGGRRLQELEEMTHKTILVKSDPALSPEAFDIA